MPEWSSKCNDLPNNRISTKKTTDYKAKINKPDTVAQKIRNTPLTKKNDFVEYKHQCHEKLDTSKTKNSIILASLRSFKREEYDTFQWLWYDYCERNNLDPVKPITIEVLEIFNFLFDEDLSYICQ